MGLAVWYDVPDAGSALDEREVARPCWLGLTIALLALAAHSDHAAATQAAGYRCTSVTCLVSEARTAFFALWHEGGVLSRIWSASSDVADRVRHVLAGRRWTGLATQRHHDHGAGGTAELPGPGGEGR